MIYEGVFCHFFSYLGGVSLPFKIIALLGEFHWPDIVALIFIKRYTDKSKSNSICHHLSHDPVQHLLTFNLTGTFL